MALIHSIKDTLARLWLPSQDDAHGREVLGLLQDVLNVLPIGVWLQDASGTIIHGNPAAKAIWAGARLVGPEQFGEYKGWWAKTGMSIAPHEWAAARAITHGETSLDEEIVIQCFDGTKKTISNSAIPIFDDQGGLRGAIIVNQDITSRKKIEQALEEREKRLRLALSGGHMGAWDVDLVSDETTWDAKEAELLGYREGDVQPSSQAFYRRVHPDDRQRVREGIRQAVSETGEVEQEFRIVHPDGQVHWMVAKGMVIKGDNGQPRRMVGITYDITHRKQAEHDLRESQEQLKALAEQLEQRVEERTIQLVQSQERLRALATELNLAEQRERNRLSAELHDHLQQLLVLGKLRLGQGKRLAEWPPGTAQVMTQIDEVLTEALTYTRTLVAELSPPVLRDQGLGAGLTWLGQYMQGRELAVTVTVPEVEVRVPEDQSLLLFLSVRELLINSWKHAGDGRATVTMHAGDSLRIEVQDEGKGFELASTETPHELSSKFGLFSIRERMKALGGSLEIESATGRGTKCVLTLPLIPEGPGRPDDLPPIS